MTYSHQVEQNNGNYRKRATVYQNHNDSVLSPVFQLPALGLKCFLTKNKDGLGSLSSFIVQLSAGISSLAIQCRLMALYLNVESIIAQQKED